MKTLILTLAVTIISCSKVEIIPPTVSPTPQPTVSISPPPSPEPKCKLADMPECGGPENPEGVWGCCDCRRPTSPFSQDVERAIQEIKIIQPNIFDGEKVLNQKVYMEGVVSILQEYGYCSRRGEPSDEVAVKDSNNISYQFDILLSNGFIRHNGIVCECKPARF